MTLFLSVRLSASGVSSGRGGDIGTIDAFGPDGVSGLVQRISAVCSRLQTGYVFHYAFAMLIGVVALITFYARGFGG